MNLIDWSDDLSVHIDEIDKQHQALLKMINRLHQASLSGDWSKEIVTLTDVLLGLIAYLEYHFSTEERYMIDAEYPEYDAHRNEHSNFVQEVADFTDAFKNGTQGLSEEMLTFLKDWYLDHVTHTDKKFGAYIKSHGCV